MLETPESQGMEVVDLRFESLRDLQEEFGPYLSSEGFFLRDRNDFATSDVLRFRLMLPGDFVLIEGVGVVVWVRTLSEATLTQPSGTAVGFATLSDQGKELVERIVQSHVEIGGKPFDMSRPSDDGDLEAHSSKSALELHEPDSQSALKFSVREEPGSEPGEIDDEPKEIDDESKEIEDEPDEMDEGGGAELRLPFEEDIQPEPDHGGPGGALEFSLPEEPSSKEDRPASWEHGDEASDSSSGARGKNRSALVGILVSIGVLAAGAWAIYTQYPELLSWSGTASEVVIAEPDEVAGEDSPAELIAPLTEKDLQAVVEAAVDAVTVPEPVRDPEPEPTVVPVVVDVLSGPGSRIVDIQADAGEGGTVITIRADGLIESRRVVTSVLANPPRILVRIFGVDSPFRPFEIPVETSEVQGIRIGHHPETNPRSLWIVVDVADAGVVIREVQTSGSVTRVEVGR